MKGKVVLVTGANGGLGTYVTQAFLDAGATVVGTSRKIQQSDFNNPNFTALASRDFDSRGRPDPRRSGCGAFRKARCFGAHSRRFRRRPIDSGHRRRDFPAHV